MNIVNRGYISVIPKQPFIDWVNTFEDNIELSLDFDNEPSVYLITEDFIDDEPVIKQHFKKIFRNELLAITEDELDWPQSISLELFLEWFEVSLGSMVFDLEKSNLEKEQVE
jgi:hypothetical protein